MINEVSSMLERYWAWLREETNLRKVDDFVEITTPYLDRHNDCLQIYAKRQDDGLLLTDDSYTIEDLELSGCKLDSPRRRELLRMTLDGFGVQMNDESKALEVRVSDGNFALRKHNLLQAMLAVNDLFQLVAPAGSAVFYDDVVKWLDTSEIRYSPSVKFTGRSGFDHRFDFVIPKSRSSPERLVRAVNRPDRQAAQAIMIAWVDTKDLRSPDSKGYAILNDSDRPASASVSEAIRHYEVRPVPWSRRREALEELAA